MVSDSEGEQSESQELALPESTPLPQSKPTKLLSKEIIATYAVPTLQPLIFKDWEGENCFSNLCTWFRNWHSRRTSSVPKSN